MAEDVHLGEHEVLEALGLKVQMLLRVKMLQFLLMYVAGAGRPRKNPHDANGNATQHNPPPAAGGLDDCHDFLVVVGQRFSWEL